MGPSDEEIHIAANKNHVRNAEPGLTQNGSDESVEKGPESVGGRVVGT